MKLFNMAAIIHSIQMNVMYIQICQKLEIIENFEYLNFELPTC